MTRNIFTEQPIIDADEIQHLSIVREVEAIKKQQNARKEEPIQICL